MKLSGRHRYTFYCSVASHFILRHHQTWERGLPGVHDIVIANATWQNGEIAQISGSRENRKFDKLEVRVISITANYSAENNYIAKYKDCLAATIFSRTA